MFMIDKNDKDDGTKCRFMLHYLYYRETLTSWSSELTKFEADLQQYDDLLEECGSTSDIDI